jgi:ribonucleoside-diphosphate reductase alpha chain
MCGLKYSSEEGRELAGKIMKFISNKSYEASAFLAVEKGTYPAFNPQDMETSGFIKGLKPSIRYMVKEKGIRNCALNSIAPCGTVSIVSGVSSGIEPIMGPAYKRMFWVGDKKETEVVVHPLFKKFVTEGKDVSHFEYGEEVPIKDHLEMQAVMQQYVDQSISKTIMLHKDVSKKKFSDYLMEYIPRVKGVTVYPVGSRGETPITPISLKEAISIVKSKQGRVGTSIEQETQDCPSGICTLG